MGNLCYYVWLWKVCASEKILFCKHCLHCVNLPVCIPAKTKCQTEYGNSSAVTSFTIECHRSSSIQIILFFVCCCCCCCWFCCWTPWYCMLCELAAGWHKRQYTDTDTHTIQAMTHIFRAERVSWKIDYQPYSSFAKQMAMMLFYCANM